jgi:hypothetical protein
MFLFCDRAFICDSDHPIKRNCRNLKDCLDLRIRLSAVAATTAAFDAAAILGSAQTSASDAVSRSPLPRAYRSFIPEILKVRFGSNWHVRRPTQNDLKLNTLM